MSESLADTLTFEGSVQGASWADTCFQNQLLYLLEINALAGLLTDISKDWNLFVRLCGTMTTLQKFSSKSSFRTLLSWPLNVSIITKEYCSFGIHFSSLSFPLWWCCDVVKTLFKRLLTWYFCFLLYYTTALLWLCKGYFLAQNACVFNKGRKNSVLWFRLGHIYWKNL